MDGPISHQNKQFGIGAITKIELNNFMSYDHILYYPRPLLNILLGPNGSGKSSIICGIVLGLGGKPKTIGRTAQLKDYVSNNTGKGKKARIEIELFNPNGLNYNIQREFNKDNRNSWHLNGKSCSQKEIDELMKKLNIQVDNLCQFLPQDKVQDFAKMNSQQLLENTLKTVGSNDMIEWHEKLINMRKNEEEAQKMVETKTNDLVRERHILSGLKNEATFVQERDKIIKHVELIKQKRAWATFGDADKDVQEITAEKETLDQIKCNAENEVEPFILEVEQARNISQSTDRELTQVMNMIGSSLNKVNRKINDLNRFEESICRINRELEAALESMRNKELEITKLTQTISDTESCILDQSKELELEENNRKLQHEINETSSKIHTLFGSEDNINHDIKALENSLKRTQARINSANDLANEKVSAFKRRCPDAYTLMMWLKDNRDQFQGRIFDPIELEITVKPEFARYVEHTIPSRDLEAFVCEFDADMSKLIQIARVDKKLTVNAISAQSMGNNPYQPSNHISNLSSYGFKCYVIDNIEGPRPILNYLCKTYHIHNIPIGSDLTETMLDSLPPSISNFFTGGNHHSIRISKYSGAKVSRVTSIRSQAYIFINTVDAVLVRELHNVLNNEQERLLAFRRELNKIHNEIQASEQTREQLKNDRKVILTQLNQLKSLRSNISMKKEELNVLKQTLIHPDLLTEDANKQIAEIILQIEGLEDKIKDAEQDYQNNLLQSKYFQLRQYWATKVLRIKEHALAGHTANLETAKRDLEAKNVELKTAQNEAKNAYERACRMTGGLAPKDRAFRNQYMEKFNELPDAVDELQAELEKFRAKIACMGEGRRSAIDEYESQLKKVTELETELANPELNLQAIREEMETIKTKWMSKVTELIDNINQKYAMYFTRMRCVGEVSLFKPAVENNFHDYGIIIKVKFRNDDRLKELGPFQQSGGERAVSTAVYMLSLQHLTTVPFRCIDEINQGMDEKNERMIYKLLMETTEEAAAAQCFLLTPKLLSNLEFSENTVVSCVLKGEVPVDYALSSKKITQNSPVELDLENLEIEHRSKKQKFNDDSKFR